MKTHLIFILLILTSPKTFAFNDFERAILFAANAASFGTFLPDMEGRIAELNLEFEKKKAELKLNYEKNRKDLLKVSLQSEVAMIEKQIELLKEQERSVKERAKSFQVTVQFAKTLFEQVSYRKEIIKEIQEHMKADPAFQANWKDLLATAGSEDAEEILLSALEAETKFEGLEYSLRSQIENLQMDLDKIKEKLGAL